MPVHHLPSQILSLK